MPDYEVTLDGKRFVLTGDHPPSEAEARQAIGSHQPEPTKAEHGYSPIETIKENFGKFKDATFGSPVSMGSILGGIAAAVPTGGMSLIPSALAVGGGSALGAGAGQIASGEKPTLGTMAGAGALGGLSELTFGGLPIALKAAAGAPMKTATKLADLAAMVRIPGARTASTALKLAQRMGGEEAAAATANTGGRLAKSQEPSIERVIGDALQETRTPPAPRAVSTPPQPNLPAGYTPRTSAPKLKVVQKAAPKAEAPAAEPELPASWKALIKPGQTQPTPQLPSSAPLGISEHAPIWSRPTEVPGNDARSMRHVFGAEDAGAQMGMEADDIRALSGEAARHRPMVARLAQLDHDYLRHINDPKAGLLLPLLAALRSGNIGSAEEDK